MFYDYVKDRGSNEAELYDLEADSGETRTLVRENPAVVERLSALARSFEWPAKLPETYSAFPKAPAAAKSPAKKSTQ